MTRCTRYNFMW